jgi:hypothetical protein
MPDMINPVGALTQVAASQANPQVDQQQEGQQISPLSQQINPQNPMSPDIVGARYMSDLTRAREANDNLMRMFDQRINGVDTGTGWKKVAALLAPTKSGHFAESFGNYANVAAEDENKNLEIAKMKADMAQKQIEQSAEMMGRGLIMQRMGLPEKVADGVVRAGGQLPTSVAIPLYNKGMLDINFIDQVRQFSPKLADGLDKSFKNATMLEDIALKYRKENRDDREFEEKYGVPIQQVLPPSAQAPAAGVATTTTTAQAPTTTQAPAQARLPHEVNVALQKERVIENEKKLNTLPQENSMAQDTINRGSEMLSLISGNENAYALLKNNPGIAQAVGTWLNEGIQLGRVGNIRLPITETMKALLPREQQTVLEQMDALLNKQALEAASLMKGSVSNYEDKMVKSIGGSVDNTAQFLNYMANKIKLKGEFDLAVNTEFEKAHKATGVLYRDFASPSNSAYKQLRQQYDNAVLSLQKETGSKMGVKGEPDAPAPQQSKADKLREEMKKRGLIKD